MQIGKTQQQVSVGLLAKPDTYFLWENDLSKPEARWWPAIFAFLGYDPLSPPRSLGERLARKRLQLGLSIRKAAATLGVDEGTFSRWESEEWKPRLSGNVVKRFLEM